MADLASFAGRAADFAESVASTDPFLSLKLRDSCVPVKRLDLNKIEGFLAAWHCLDGIQESLTRLLAQFKKRKAAEQIKKAEALLSEIEPLSGAVKGAIRKVHIFDWIDSLVFAFVLAMFIRTFFVQAFKIPTGSMRPTLLEGDLILVNKFIYGAKIPFTKNMRLPPVGDLQRGDVIVFIYPEDPKKDFIKRLVGLPGETVEIKNGTIYINGYPLTDSVFGRIFYYNMGDFEKSGFKINVPGDSYFVLGDNSASSKDSRYWGFVPRKNIIGKAMIIYFPPQRIRIIK
ncbi:MAG: signal peptidase I [Candidatus Omnitrophica bacterium]|nr:signal peptidase I [Candidatus Omnitrophota bacterium]